ncbi:uncharacterized protein N7459_001721 [Penicillium hispanicum]|uniref:uncharacterized protein n=1 Tax=Penicillium hispanicum TaxID=1080232 RepID=UPI00253FEE6D|nr:uncharacterized protein N7459_001721 [Penicillium hispanicum]KAJ5595513.1 hypothetical protein N7459_001721 [Penicillium hispanicum]
MKPLKASVDGLQLLYYPKHQFTPVALRYIRSPFHPIHPKIAHMWNDRDQSGLWWRASTHQLLSFKRVVRSWCARRARIAFQEALKQRGFDKLGISLPTTASGQQEDLTGSLEIIIRPTFVQQTYQAVQHEMNHLLDKILRQRAIRRDSAAKTLWPSSRSRVKS